MKINTTKFLQKLTDEGVKAASIDKAEAQGVPREILLAFIYVESGGRAKAMRYEKKYRWIFEVSQYARRQHITRATEEELQKFSYGLLQIMGATARSECNYDGYLTDLLDPNINIRISVAFLRRLRKRYYNWRDVISAYNQGSPKKRFFTNKYKNQDYVDKVVNAARHFGWKL